MAIVERARHFLVEVRDFKSIAATDKPAGELRVGAFQSALSGMLPDILALMKDKYPQIQVRITRGISSELYRNVLNGELDTAIIAQPSFAIPKSYDWRLLREEPLILLTRAPAPSRKPFAILASQPFIRLDRNLWPGRLVDGYLRQAGIRPREFFEMDRGRGDRCHGGSRARGIVDPQIGRPRGRRAYRSPNYPCRTPPLCQTHRPHMGKSVGSVFA